MSKRRLTARQAAFVLTALGIATAVSPVQAAEDTGAHALAQKFAASDEAEAKRRAEKEEADMLERARAEAAERDRAEKARADDEASRAELQRLIESEEAGEKAAGPTAVATPVPTLDRKAREQEFIRVEQRLRAAEQKAEAARAAEAKRDLERRQAEALKAVAEQRAREDAKRLATEEAARREQELHDLERQHAEALKAAEEKRLADENVAREGDERRQAAARADEERRALEHRHAEALKAAEDKRLAAERAAQEAEERRRTAESAAREAEERRSTAERAAHEAEERRVAAEQRAQEAEAAAADEARLAAEAVAAEQRQKEGAEQRQKEAAEQRAKETAEQREKDAAEQRVAEHRPPRAEAEAVAVPREGETHDARPLAPTAAVGKVAVLLIIEPGTNGIRRYGRKVADPVLCRGTTCFISTGAGSAAKSVARGTALGPANTLGKRAGACNQKLACVWREVDLGGAGASIQPIDLRIMRHDRRPELAVTVDRTCDYDGARLFCSTLYRAASWRAWVVPETLAVQAGPAALEAALARGLPSAREATAGRR